MKLLMQFRKEEDLEALSKKYQTKVREYSKQEQEHVAQAEEAYANVKKYQLLLDATLEAMKVK